MKKILSLGLFIIISCSFMVGCNSKITRDEIDEYEEQESTIEFGLKTASEKLDSVVTYSNLIWNTEDKKTIDELYQKMSSNLDYINEVEQKLNKISLDELSNFHNYMVEYKGTTQEKEDNKFMRIKCQYLLAKRKLAYADKIIDLYSDGTLSSEEYDKIKIIEFISDDPSNGSSNENVKKLQQELDKEYFLDSKELYDLYDKLKYMNEEDFNG